MKQQDYKVGAYCRLSREDEDNIGESASITMQKEIIRQYCESNGMTVETYYQDDGFTGTNFNRPDFMRMMADVEAGKINCIITKDLSRLGRDYIMTGYYLEVYFPQKSIRYIAIGDGYDNLNKTSNNDFAPFKMVMNDLYAKDISNKGCAAFRAKALRGEHTTTCAPYGYKKDPEVANHLIPDEETSPIVKLIFQMYVAGNGSCKIRDYLTENQILTPAAILFTRGQRNHYHLKIDEGERALYLWNEQTIYGMLKDELYIGNSVHYRSKKPNHKSKLKKQPKEDWLIIADTHEAIIDKETFEAVQKRMQLRAKPQCTHENIFTGIIKCADCGRSLALSSNPKKGGRAYGLTCTGYRKYGKALCPSHYVGYAPLKELIAQRLNHLIELAQISEDKMLAQLKKAKSTSAISVTTVQQKRMTAIEKRLAEIDKIFVKLYEDRVLGSITEGNYKLMSDKLTTEQSRIQPELEQLRSKLADTIASEENVVNFVDLISSAKRIENLDAQTLAAYVDKIEIHQACEDENGKLQLVDIFYKFIGQIPE